MTRRSTTGPGNWVLLSYRMPREPSTPRITIWRKLKRLGALLLHDAVWVLPATPWTREQFQWLAVEIGELEGEAYLWESRLLLNGQADALAQQFQARVDATYQEILDEANSMQPDLIVMSSHRPQRHAVRTYFLGSNAGHVVRYAKCSVLVVRN